jgi:hypothetical protein
MSPAFFEHFLSLAAGSSYTFLAPALAVEPDISPRSADFSKENGI